MTGPVTINLAEALGSDILARIEKFFAQGITVEYPLHEKDAPMLNDSPNQPTTFTASTGYNVAIVDGNIHGVRATDEPGTFQSTQYLGAGSEWTQTLREYFQHERDEQLGRWRDPENSHMVVYPHSANVVRVVNEKNGITWDVTRPLHLDDLDAPTWHGAAARYFAEHPARQPWHSAQPGEVWVLDLGNGPGRESPATVSTYPEFRTAAGNYLSLNDPSILHATRIWPEESDDER